MPCLGILGCSSCSFTTECINDTIFENDHFLFSYWCLQETSYSILVSYTLHNVFNLGVTSKVACRYFKHTKMLTLKIQGIFNSTYKANGWKMQNLCFSSLTWLDVKLYKNEINHIWPEKHTGGQLKRNIIIFRELENFFFVLGLLKTNLYKCFATLKVISLNYYSVWKNFVPIPFKKLSVIQAQWVSN